MARIQSLNLDGIDSENIRTKREVVQNNSGPAGRTTFRNPVMITREQDACSRNLKTFTSGNFQEACSRAGIPATKRQASKYSRGFGAARKAR